MILRKPILNPLKVKKSKKLKIRSSPSIFDLAGTFTPKDKKKIVNAVKIRDYMEKHYERV